MGAVRWVMPAVFSCAVSSALGAPTKYHLMELGFTGPGYEFNSSGELYQSSNVMEMNGAGDVAGWSARFDPTGASLGSDSWVFTSTGGLRQVGLTGDGYNDLAATASPPFTGVGLIRYSGVMVMNGAGQAAGVSSRYGPFSGQDAWFYDGSTTMSIGLTTGANASKVADGIFVSNTVKAMNDAGQVVGAAEDVANGGQDVWIYSGGTTTQIGFTSGNYLVPSGYRQSGVLAINNSGEAIGESYSFAGSNASVGSDEWVYKKGVTVAIGLTGTDYTYVLNGVTTRDNQPSVAINDAGDVIGETLRYTGDQSEYLGQDAWVYNGSSTHVVGLVDADHSYLVNGRTFRIGTVTALNASGAVIGYSQRYNSLGVGLGQDAWMNNGSTTQQIGLTGGEYTSAYSGGGGGVLQTSVPLAINNAGNVIGYSHRGFGYDAWFFDGSVTARSDSMARGTVMWLGRRRRRALTIIR